MFQHTAARRRLLIWLVSICYIFKFQHTAARRRLHEYGLQQRTQRLFQHTAARRRLPHIYKDHVIPAGVSTHSRAKAAAHT